jgi:tetratricopeptide (TPR) repeat protein
MRQKSVLEDALRKARSHKKRGHEAQLLILLGRLTAQMGNRTQAIAYLENAGQFATQVQFFRMEADAMFELAKLYRDSGDLATADARATQGLAASQRVGDRHYVPRNLAILADLKARRGRTQEANALYEQAEDVIEGMLVSVDEPYWNSSVAAPISQTYLQHFELLNQNGDLPGAFRILERIRGRTLASALEDKKTLPAAESDQTLGLENDVSALQTRLLQATSLIEREQLLDKLVEYERRLGLAWTRGDAPNQRFPVQPASLTKVKDDLNPDEVFLEYVLDDPNSFCLSISRKGTYLRVLPVGRREIQRVTQQFVDELRAKGTGINGAKQLYAWLLQPIPETAKTNKVVIAPWIWRD